MSNIDDVKDKTSKSYINFILSTNPYNLILWICSFTLIALFLIISYFGSQEKWYVNLPDRGTGGTLLIAGLWVAASLISYGTFYIVRNYDEKIYGQSRILALYLIIGYLNIFWIIIFFKYQNLLWTLILLMIVFSVQFYLLIFTMNINFYAGLLILPLQLMYGYLFYSILTLAAKNDLII